MARIVLLSIGIAFLVDGGTYFLWKASQGLVKLGSWVLLDYHYLTLLVSTFVGLLYGRTGRI